MATNQVVCLLCGEPVDPDAPTTVPQVTAWANPVIDAVEDIRPTGGFAHEACVDAAEQAESPPPFVVGGP
jgi:hypothetical protein